MIVLGLDPGPTHSALVSWNGSSIIAHSFELNAKILAGLYALRFARLDNTELRVQHPALVIEKVESFGMAVGAETFETVWWSGRFAEAYGIDIVRVHRIGRKAIKVHLCGSARATDANIRQAILDRFGGKDAAIGRKKNPGPLYNISGHLWSALAVALTFHDQRCDVSTSRERAADSDPAVGG